MYKYYVLPTNIFYVKGERAMVFEVLTYDVLQLEHSLEHFPRLMR